MTIRIFSKVASSAAILAGWAWLTAGSCDISIVRPSIQDCGITYDTNFPAGGTLDLNKPAKCPINLLGPQEIPYAATGDFPINSPIYTGSLKSAVIDRQGRSSTYYFNQDWGGNGTRRWVFVSGNYIAALGGFSNGGGYDDVKSTFDLSTGGTTSATVRIPYEIGDPATRFEAPSTVDASTYYTVSASTSDPMMVGPISWAWYVDGSYRGTTSSPDLSIQAGGPNTSQMIQAIITDPNGRTVSGTTSVWTSSGCVDENGHPVDQC